MDDSLAKVVKVGAILEDAGNTSNEVLAEAQSFIEHLKTNASVELLGDLLFGILTGSQFSTGAKLVALHVFEEGVLRSRWQSLDENYTRRISSQLVELLRSGNWSNGVDQKLAALTSGIALRDWPQRWPTFVDEMIAISEVGGSQPYKPNQAYISTLVIRFLCLEICEGSETIAAEKRQKLSGALHVSLQQILPFLCTVAALAYDTRYTHESGLLLVTCLETIQAMLSFAPLVAVFQYNVVKACANLLYDEEYQDSAMDCLDTMGKIRGTRAKDCEDYLRSVFFPLMLELSSKFNVGQRHAEPTELQLRLVNLLCVSGVSFLGLAYSADSVQASAEHMTILRTYMELMFNLTLVASNHVSLDVLHFWQTILRESLPTHSVVAEYAGRITAVLVFKLALIHERGDEQPVGSLPVESAVDELEEDQHSKEERVRVTAMECARSAIMANQSKVLGTVHVISNRLSTHMMNVPDQSASSASEKFSVPEILGNDPSASVVDSFYGFAFILEALISLAKDLNEVEQVALAQLYLFMLSTSKRHGDLQQVSVALTGLAALASLKPLISVPWAETVEVLIQYCKYGVQTSGEATVKDLSEEAKKIRMKACTTLLRVIKRLNEDILRSLLPQFFSQVEYFFNPDGAVPLRHEERLHILEAVSYASGMIRDEQQVSRIMRLLLEPSFAILIDKQMEDYMRSPEAFQQLLNDSHARSQLAENIHVIEVVLHGATKGSIELAISSKLVEPMMKLTNVLHIANPSPTSRELVVMLKLERCSSAIQRKNALRRLGIELPEIDMENLTYLSQLRDSVYAIVGSLISHTSGTPSLSLQLIELFSNAVLAHIARLEPVSIYALARGPFRVAAKILQSIESASFLQTLAAIELRVASGIQVAADVDQAAESIAIDHAWRLILRACVDIIGNFLRVMEAALSPGPNKAEETTNLPEKPSIVLPDIMSSFLLKAMYGFDSTASASACSLVLEGLEHFHVETVIHAAVLALSKNDLHSVHEQVVSVLYGAIAKSPEKAKNFLFRFSSISQQSIMEMIEAVSTRSRKTGRAALKNFLRRDAKLSIGVPEGSKSSTLILDLDKPLIIPGKISGRFKDPEAAAARKAASEAQTPIDLGKVFTEDNN